MPEAIDELIARHHDGDLDEAGLERLVAALEADPQARAAFRHDLRLTAWLRQEAGLRREATPRAQASKRRAGGPPAVPGGASRWRRWAVAGGTLAAAAGLAVALLWPTGIPEGMARFGGALVATGETVRGHGDLRWRDGSVATLESDAVLRLESDGRRAQLLDGGLTAQVAHQPPSARFTIDAGPARLTALGTRFSIRTGPGGTRAEVAEGIVALGDSSEPGLAYLLYPGDTWSTSTTWASGRTVRDPAALAAARSAGRVEGDVLIDLRFDEGGGTTVHDRSGRAPAMDLALVPGAGTWGKDGLTLIARDALRWEGPATRIREAIAAGALTIEIAWTGAAAPGRYGNLLELGGDLDQDAVAVTVTPADTIHHLAWRLGPDGLDLIADGSQFFHRGGPDSEAVTRSHLVLGREHQVLALRGISYPATIERASRGSGDSWRVTYRRVTIHGRALTLGEIRRNALADEALRSRGR